MQRLPSGTPTTGSQQDVMLLYQDPVTDGPQTSPPAMASEGCCPGCGCRLTTSGDCPGGRCPLPNQRNPQQYGNGGGGLFPSLPPNRNQDERLIPRPQDLLRESFPLPRFADVLPWLIVAGFVVFVIVWFVRNRFEAAVQRAAGISPS